MRFGLFSVVFVLCLLFVLTANAQEAGPGSPTNGVEAPRSPTRSYPGVAPGADHAPPKARGLKGSRRLWVTWPGFQMRSDGASRVFVQASAAPEYQRLQQGRRLTLRIKNARIHLRNNKRPLNTQFFPTPVNRVRLVRRKRDVDLVIELREDAVPDVRQEVGAGGYAYLVVEFAPTAAAIEGLQKRARSATTKPVEDLPAADAPKDVDPPVDTESPPQPE